MSAKTARGKAKKQPKVIKALEVVHIATAPAVAIRLKVFGVCGVYDQRPTAHMAPVRVRFGVRVPLAKGLTATEREREVWFYGLDLDHFKHQAKRWNEENLLIQIPDLDGYDDWLNYFKDLSPSVIKQLAVSGLDFLPTDGYAALSRWHDIITHPGRIDKIHQSGLTRRRAGQEHKTILELAQANDRLGVLKATRDRIAEKLEKGAGARDTAALAREMTEVMTQIADYEKRQGPKKTTVLGKLLGDVDLRKRPGKNGGGARNTSFKSRVTIKDVEG